MKDGLGMPWAKGTAPGGGGTDEHGGGSLLRDAGTWDGMAMGSPGGTGSMHKGMGGCPWRRGPGGGGQHARSGRGGALQLHGPRLGTAQGRAACTGGWGARGPRGGAAANAGLGGRGGDRRAEKCGHPGSPGTAAAPRFPPGAAAAVGVGKLQAGAWATTRRAPPDSTPPPTPPQLTFKQDDDDYCSPFSSSFFFFLLASVWLSPPPVAIPSVWAKLRPKGKKKKRGLQPPPTPNPSEAPIGWAVGPTQCHGWGQWGLNPGAFGGCTGGAAGLQPLSRAEGSGLSLAFSLSFRPSRPDVPGQLRLLGSH